MNLSEIARAGVPSTGEIRLEGAERLLNLSITVQGQERRATVTLRILDADQRIARDRACAVLASPSLFDDLPVQARGRIWMISTIAQALQDPPDWLSALVGTSEALLASLYQEVEAHERLYFRSDVAESETEQGINIQITRVAGVNP